MAGNERYIGKALVIYTGGIQGMELTDVSGDEPAEVFIGGGLLPRGIEHALMEMEVGEERHLVLQPIEAYGFYDEKGVQTYPRLMVEKGKHLDVGERLTWQSPVTGELIAARVIDGDEESVTIDMNHPYAGQVMEYDITLVSHVD